MADSWGNHVAIVVDGILKQPNDSGVLVQGLLLYKSLVKDHRVSLIIDSAAKEKVQYWLLMNSLTDHVNEIYWEDIDPDDAPSRRIAQVGRLRKQGPLSLVFEADTTVATALLNAGIPSFLYLHPQYTHPEHRPGFRTEITPWDDLLAEKIRQQEARATDTRLTDIF
jgi:hypothetical protein